MAHPPPSHLAQARRIEQLASDLHTLSVDMAEPCRSHRQFEAMVEEGERIAATLRAEFRG